MMGILAVIRLAETANITGAHDIERYEEILSVFKSNTLSTLQGR